MVHFLCRNVKNEHLREIFGVYGKLRSVELQVDPRANLSKGFAYIQYEDPEHAEGAVISMNEGQVDGNVIHVSYVLVDNIPRRSMSPGMYNAR